MFSIPRKGQGLIQIGSGTALAPRPDLKLLVWNIYKGQRRKWEMDFLELSRDMDLILLQEALHDGWMPGIWTQHFPDHHWKMATSFAFRSLKTGVTTGSRFRASYIEYLRGTEKEFFVGTPKVSLASKYSFSGHNKDPIELLVINTHVVNFTTTRGFVNFIEELLGLVASHNGPMIIGGDFNTWNNRRWHSLQKILAEFKVNEVSFETDQRLLKLDHVFIRGLKVKNALIHHHIRSSDHYPLEVWLELMHNF